MTARDWRNGARRDRLGEIADRKFANAGARLCAVHGEQVEGSAFVTALGWKLGLEPSAAELVLARRKRNLTPSHPWSGRHRQLGLGRLAVEFRVVILDLLTTIGILLHRLLYQPEELCLATVHESLEVIGAQQRRIDQV